MFGLVPFAKNIAKSNDDFNKLFDVFNEPFFHEPFAKMNSYVKSFKVDVKDTDKAYELTAELPGIAKENISLDYNKGYLTIKTTTNKIHKKKNLLKIPMIKTKNLKKNIFAVNVM